MGKHCIYCNKFIDVDEYLHCKECKFFVHIKCLKNSGTPGDLLGDVFFEFECSNCSNENGNERFTRISLPWAMLIVLAIHNLSFRSEGLGRQGFFHWRRHIATFIEHNWTVLMEAAKIKKKWTGTISGTLSHNTPSLFTSGFETFQDSGWWKLTYSHSPRKYMEMYKKMRKEKFIDVMPSTSAAALSVTQEVTKSLEDNTFSSRSLPFMGRHRRSVQSTPNLLTTNTFSTDFMSPSSTLDILDLNPDYCPGVNVATTANEWPHDFMNVENLCNSDSINQYKPRIVQVTNFQEASADDLKISNVLGTHIIKKEIDNDADEDMKEYSRRYVCDKSLFTKSVKRKFPWDTDHTNTDEYVDQDEDIVIMTEYEENEILKKLKSILNNDVIEVPSWVKQFSRSLSIRELKRSLGKRVFDIDNLSTNNASCHGQILDRYQHLISTSSQKKTFYSALAGSTDLEMFESPHTRRILHPYIYRDSKSISQWVKLLCELQYTVNEIIPSRASLDYCYVRPHHIAAVNSLLQHSFWPEIDMSECLSYPDFSIVALYKKLVVGCAFLVPDVGHSAAYVSFMAVRHGWQRAGIGSFMLYHLTQTCMGKDITLHVSATNTAICLYQKFGFKIEEVILDFYEKYLPKESRQSKHAFFLRLKR